MTSPSKVPKSLAPNLHGKLNYYFNSSMLSTSDSSIAVPRRIGYDFHPPTLRLRLPETPERYPISSTQGISRTTYPTSQYSKSSHLRVISHDHIYFTTFQKPRAPTSYHAAPLPTSHTDPPHPIIPEAVLKAFNSMHHPPSRPTTKRHTPSHIQHSTTVVDHLQFTRVKLSYRKPNRTDKTSKRSLRAPAQRTNSALHSISVLLYSPGVH